MMTQRGYSIGLAVCFALVWGVITWYVVTTPPYTGDLTRLGGYTEQDFAPLAGITVFPEKLWTQAETLAEYDRYYDVVVIGDSFSHNATYGWQSYLEAATGWSIITFHRDRVSVPDLLQSEAFREHPPRLFVYEIVEHGLHSFNPGLEPVGEDVALAKVTTALEVSPEPVTMVQTYQSLTPTLSISDGVHRLQRDVKRLIGSRARTIRCDLSAEGFFSNRDCGDILIYYGDYWKNDVPPEQWAGVAQQLVSLRKRVEADGVTHFAFMLVPDKSSVFRPYIIDPPRPILNTLELLPDAEDIPRLPLHETIGEAIRKGELQDIYLPNDTHWGNAGHAIAARSLLDFMGNRGALEQPAFLVQAE